MSNKVPATQKILNYLRNKENFLTVRRARDRFGIQNVAARVKELREDGYYICTGTKRAKNGRTVSFYHLSEPSRVVVRAALQAGYSFQRENNF
jgi:predicted ArsR family transcriptional regulator